jgi:hypothetical protein
MATGKKIGGRKKRSKNRRTALLDAAAKSGKAAAGLYAGGHARCESRQERRDDMHTWPGAVSLVARPRLRSPRSVIVSNLSPNPDATASGIQGLRFRLRHLSDATLFHQ